MKGLFLGVSLEGSVITARKDCNRRFYGQPVTVDEIASGAVEPPKDAHAQPNGDYAAILEMLEFYGRDDGEVSNEYRAF